MKSIGLILTIAYFLMISSTISWAKGDLAMSQDLKKQLDTFFSNFSEVNMPPFYQGKIPNETLILFGIDHNVKNNHKLIKNLKDGSGSLSQKYVEQSVKKYFGDVLIKHGTIGNYHYSKGIYIFPLGDGEPWQFSQITKLVDIGNQCFIANIKVYWAPNAFDGDTHASESVWKSDPDEEMRPSLDKMMIAKIKKITENKKSRYILLEYLPVNIKK